MINSYKCNFNFKTNLFYNIYIYVRFNLTIFKQKIFT